MMRLLLLALLSLAPVFAAAQDAPLTRPDVERIVREYLLANPEVLEEAFTALQAKRQQEAEVARAGALEEWRAALERSDHSPVLGNPDGDVTLVEFFDYNCGYCRRAMEDLQALVATDPKLRVVLKEFPVLGQGSMEAAQVSIAVHRVAPDAYGEFHARLMGREAGADREAALEVARDMGLPVDEIAKVSREEAAIRPAVEESYDIARALGLTGTPSYVIGDGVEFGAVGVERLQARVNEARCGAATC